MTFYRRNLPHWFMPEHSVFLTWRLYGSLPASYFARLREPRNLSDGEKFRDAETFLDDPGSGPLWLEDPRIAECIVREIRRGSSELGHYDLYSFVVMANHAHALIRPQTQLRLLTRTLK
jgi:putative transposase